MPGEPPLSPQLILRLQATSGNRVVQRLLRRQAMPRTADKIGRSRARQPPGVSVEHRDRTRSGWWRWLPRLFRGGRQGR
jgi:hypothetical protein